MSLVHVGECIPEDFWVDLDGKYAVPSDGVWPHFMVTTDVALSQLRFEDPLSWEVHQGVIALTFHTENGPRTYRKVGYDKEEARTVWERIND